MSWWDESPYSCALLDEYEEALTLFDGKFVRQERELWKCPKHNAAYRKLWPLTSNERIDGDFIYSFFSFEKCDDKARLAVYLTSNAKCVRDAASKRLEELK